MPRPVITLTTDFGSQSTYVAQMTGVILQRAAEATIVDLCHTVPPQNIRFAARFWRQSVPQFPANTIHVGVVDPGVGTSRRLVYAMLDGQHLLAPDNGFMSELALRVGTRPLPVIVLANAELWQPNVSDTFHGRDILAPVAAYLARGGDPENLGPHDTLQEWLDVPQPVVTKGRIEGEVVEVDTFGNLMTNISAELLENMPPEQVVVLCGSQRLPGLTRTYGMHRPGTLVALVGSQGVLELAVVNGNAAQEMGVVAGAKVTVETGSRSRR